MRRSSYNLSRKGTNVKRAQSPTMRGSLDGEAFRGTSEGCRTRPEHLRRAFDSPQELRSIASGRCWNPLIAAPVIPSG